MPSFQTLGAIIAAAIAAEAPIVGLIHSPKTNKLFAFILAEEVAALQFIGGFTGMDMSAGTPTQAQNPFQVPAPAPASTPVSTPASVQTHTPSPVIPMMAPVINTSTGA